MSLFRNDSAILLTLDGVGMAEEEEDLYTSSLLGKTNNFEDWMEKAGVDCFFMKTNSTSSVQSDVQLGNDMEGKKPNILRSQNPKTDRNMNVQKGRLKDQILAQKSAAALDVSVSDRDCSFVIKDSEGDVLFPPQKLNNPIDQTSTSYMITAITQIPLAKVSLKETLPQITTNLGTKFYLCPLADCKEAFQLISNAKLHALKHMGIKPYKCDIGNCLWEFYTQFKLQRHKETHLNRKLFMCTHPNCHRGFTTIYNLKCHKKQHDKPASLECPVKDCTELFQNDKERRLHYKEHDQSEAPFKCDFGVCFKSFFTHTALQTHSKCHTHKESDLNCEFPNCGRTFHTPYRLKEHYRTHTGQKPYVCDFQECSWRFTTASKLRRHQSTHTKDRKFHCTIGNCSKSFVRSEHLRDHTLTHIGGQRTYECCNVTFSGKSALYSHNKKFHPKKQVSTVVYKTDQNADVLLEQAIQSLDVVTDMGILGPNCPLPDELLESDPDFSTVNLRDLD